MPVTSLVSSPAVRALLMGLVALAVGCHLSATLPPPPLYRSACEQSVSRWLCLA